MNAADARAMYRREIAKHGEVISIVRGASTWSVKARAISHTDRETSGNRVQNIRRFVIVAADLVATGFTHPFVEKSDRIVFAGKTLTITVADDTRRRIGGELIAYEIEAMGG